MNTARRGNGKENATARLLEADGWLVGSRRHVGGAGDLLAVKEIFCEAAMRLIEVKATQTPYAHFGPEDRALMVAAAEEYGVVAELAWWGPRAKAPEFIPSSDWP